MGRFATAGGFAIVPTMLVGRMSGRLQAERRIVVGCSVPRRHGTPALRRDLRSFYGGASLAGNAIRGLTRLTGDSIVDELGTASNARRHAFHAGWEHKPEGA